MKRNMMVLQVAIGALTEEQGKKGELIMEKRIYDETNGLYYTLEEDGRYYPELELPEGTRYDIGKYGLMRQEYLAKYNRAEYIRLFLEGVLNEPS